MIAEVEKNRLSGLPTPCFVLDEDRLISNMERIGALRSLTGVKLLFSLKAFSTYSLFRYVRDRVDGAAVSSLNEARLAAEELGKPIHAYSPAYDERDLGEFLPICDSVTFNSVGQLERFSGQINGSSRRVSQGIRLQLDLGEVSRFYDEAAPRRLGVTLNPDDDPPRGVDGILVHTLFEDLGNGLEKLVHTLDTRYSTLLRKISWLSLGGGHLLADCSYDSAQFARRIKHLKEIYGLDVIVEPGAAYFWKAGYLVTRVLDVVPTSPVPTAMLDVSFAAHAPDCITMPYRPAVRGELPEGTAGTAYILGGRSCLSIDYVGPYSFNRNLLPGDLVVIEDMLHYSIVKSSTFNGIGPASIAVLHRNGEIVLERTYSYESYKSRL